MIIDFKIFESIKNSFEMCEFYLYINGDIKHVIGVLQLLENKENYSGSKSNIHYIFGRQLMKNIFVHIEKTIENLIDLDNFYKNRDFDGIFIFFIPSDYDESIGYKLLRKGEQKDFLIDKYPEKFKGELKVEDGKLVIDDLEVNIRKYNL